MSVGQGWSSWPESSTWLKHASALDKYGISMLRTTCPITLWFHTEMWVEVERQQDNDLAFVKTVCQLGEMCHKPVQMQKIKYRAGQKVHLGFSIRALSFPTLCTAMDCSPLTTFCPWNFPGTNTEVGCHCLPQRIFLTQWSNPHLVHWLAGSLPWTTWEVVSYDAKRFFNGSVHCKLSIRQYPHV